MSLHSLNENSGRWPSFNRSTNNTFALSRRKIPSVLEYKSCIRLLREMEKKERAIFVLCLAYGFWYTGSQWTSTLLNFLQWDTKPVMSIVELGYIQAFGSFCNAIGAFFLGQLIDSAGPKAVMFISALMAGGYYSLLSLATGWHSFLWIQLFRLGYHFEATSEMYLATVTTERERARAMLLLTIPQSVSLFVGPLLGAKFAQGTSMRISQFASGLFVAGSLIPLVLWALPGSHSVPSLAIGRFRPQDYWPLLRDKPALREGLLLRVIIVAAYVSFDLIARQFLLRPHLKSPFDAAIVLLLMAFVLVTVQIVLLPRLQRRHELTPRLVLQTALAVQTGSYAVAGICRGFWRIAALSSVHVGAYAVAYAETSALITTAVERGDLGKATGLASVGSWTVYFLVPLATSHLANVYHYTYAFYASVILGAIAFTYVSVAARYINARLYTELPTFGMTRSDCVI